MTGVPLNIDWQQILLHLFNFTILFGALYILLYKPVKNFMEGREAHYADMDSKATQALADAESSKASYEKKERDFDEEVRAEKNRMSKEIEALRPRAARPRRSFRMPAARPTGKRKRSSNPRRRRSQAWSPTRWKSSLSSRRLRMLSTSSSMLRRRRINE